MAGEQSFRVWQATERGRERVYFGRACIITHSSMADGWSDKSAWAAVPGGERFASRLEPCPYCDSNSCREIECPNNPICGEVLQRCIADAHGGTCLNCAFGGLVVKDFTTATDDCPICLQQAELHVLLDCGHKVCTDCFKKPWTPLSQRGPIPEDFGCTDVEVLLDRDDDELIQQKVAEWAAREPEQAAAYNQAWSEWMEKEGRAREAKRLALARCPLCRKPTTWATQEERDELEGRSRPSEDDYVAGQRSNRVA